MTRREAFSAAALLGVAAPQNLRAAEPLPDTTLFERDPERYWKRIREEQFFLPDWRAFLNNGSLGVTPKPVFEAVVDYMKRAAGLLMDEYPRWGYETLDEHRAEMAEFLGCRRDELAFTHNATEALSVIANGIDMKAGDEVVITDLEHPSGKSPWRLKQARYGISVREVAVPLPPRDPAQLADLLVSAIGPRTKVLMFSGILSPTGTVMPVRQVCDAARAKGVISIVDGAHMNGQMPLKLNQLGCDYYAGSPHKWMFAPAGCGILYGRPEMLDKLWPSIVTGEWDNKELGAARFMKIGTNNRAIMEGMIAGLRFMKQIGPERIYARIHQQAKETRRKMAALGFLELLTPDDGRLYASLVTIRFPKNADLGPLWEEVKRRRIWVSAGQQVRLSSHIHTRPEDVDSFVEAIKLKVRA
ncbi:MAG: aminotransferase class V-fold PLP-dependent enzyme [Bryobacteraceae bacterium]|nr:aminotransferase class V-fold PLP-dependent enzyme [Bryobacteraceae bacterium]